MITSGLNFISTLLTCNELKWSEWPTRGMRTWLPSFWVMSTSVIHGALNSCKRFKILQPPIASNSSRRINLLLHKASVYSNNNKQTNKTRLGI